MIKQLTNHSKTCIQNCLKIRRITCLIIGFMLFIGPVFYKTSADEQKPGFAPLNPEFLKYKKNHPPTPTATAASKKEHLHSWIPHPLDLSHIKGAVDEKVHQTYPTRYDLREHNKLSPIKDQGNCGSCWTFGVFASLESCLLPGEETDFSEQHLNANHGFDYPECRGGNIYIATAYLTRWDGPVAEAYERYPHALPASTGSSWGGGGNPAWAGAADPFLNKHVQQVIMLPNRCGPDVVLHGTGDGIIDGYEPAPRQGRPMLLL
ncbi:MAG: hypothetical protein KAW12_15350 [Candidatus Aminicenantes bacterium]|nr:hypothetical protein [Candidatus Aminicenantes bacterium]